jgi:predicted nucleotidyltransferase
MTAEGPPVSLTRYAEERDALLTRIVHVLEADSRVVAAWLAGSFGRGEADAWSDLDLHVAVATDLFPQFLAEREALYQQVGRPILSQEEKVSDSQTDARFQLVLYPGPIEVDWNIGPVATAQRPLAFRMLIERGAVPVVTPPPLSRAERRDQASHWLTFFWAMAPIAIKYCGRGQPACELVSHMTRSFIALWRLVAEPEGPNPILPATNRVLEPELDAQVPRLGPTTNPLQALAVIDELCRRVQELHPALESLGAVVSPEVPTDVTKLQRIAEEVVQWGTIPRRTYR